MKFGSKSFQDVMQDQVGKLYNLAQFVSNSLSFYHSLIEHTALRQSHYFRHKKVFEISNWNFWLHGMHLIPKLLPFSILLFPWKLALLASLSIVKFKRIFNLKRGQKGQFAIKQWQPRCMSFEFEFQYHKTRLSKRIYSPVPQPTWQEAHMLRWRGSLSQNCNLDCSCICSTWSYGCHP